ncbi:MAG: hypothetical protein WEA80_01825 [Gemmatimonadaceae bacterium]
MADLANSLEDLVATWAFRSGAGAPTRPAAQFIALYTAVTDAEAGTGTEVTGGAYARAAVTFGAPSDGAMANDAEINMTASGANWGTVTHFCIRDASTAGNALSIVKALAASKVINDGDTLQFAAGAITVAIA